MCWYFTWNSAQYCIWEMNSEETLETAALLYQLVQWYFKFPLSQLKTKSSFARIKETQNLTPKLFSTAYIWSCEMDLHVEFFQLNFIFLINWKLSPDLLKKFNFWSFWNLASHLNHLAQPCLLGLCELFDHPVTIPRGIQETTGVSFSAMA